MIGLIVSVVACIFTCLTYRKSHDILEIIDLERKYRWNQRELESLFSNIPIDSIESFIESPEVIRKELWEGLRSIDLTSFQFIGKERNSIVNFIRGLESFCFMHYEQVPSGHWKYQPLSNNENFDADKENQNINDLHEKANALSPLLKELKLILLKYHVNIRDINMKAYDNYYNKQKEELEQY